MPQPAVRDEGGIKAESGLDPFKYLVYVFEKAPNSDIRNNLDVLQGLMPWCVPDYIRPAKVMCPAV